MHFSMFTSAAAIVAFSSAAAAAPGGYDSYNKYHDYKGDYKGDYEKHEASTYYEEPKHTPTYYEEPKHTPTYYYEEPEYMPTYSAESSYSNPPPKYEPSDLKYKDYKDDKHDKYHPQHPVTAPNGFWNILYFHSTLTIKEPEYPDPKKGFSIKLTETGQYAAANDAFTECLKISLAKADDEKANFIGVFFDEHVLAWFCQATVDGKTVVGDATESYNPIKGYEGNKIRESAGFVFRIAPNKPEKP